jgi:hypothetical protein
MRAARALPLLLLLGLGLAACGVNGAPSPPKPDSFPRQYPAPDPIPGVAQPPPSTTDSTTQPMYQ